MSPGNAFGAGNKKHHQNNFKHKDAFNHSKVVRGDCRCWPLLTGSTASGYVVILSACLSLCQNGCHCSRHHVQGNHQGRFVGQKGLVPADSILL